VTTSTLTVNIHHATVTQAQPLYPNLPDGMHCVDLTDTGGAQVHMFCSVAELRAAIAVLSAAVSRVDQAAVTAAFVDQAAAFVPVPFDQADYK